MITININRLNFEIRRIRKIPPHTLIIKLLIKILGYIIGITFLQLTAALHILGYRHVTIFTDRIGHLALEPDCLLKEVTLGLIPKYKWILLAPPSRVANEHLLNYWAPYFFIIRNQIICLIISNMSRWWMMRQDVTKYIRNTGKAQQAYEIYNKCKNKSSILKLCKEDETWGKNMLEKLGLPKGRWFVCVHTREGGFSPIDEELHTYRNCRIENTFPAIKEIIKSGGWVIRIGDSSMQRLPQIEKVIDYAHEPLKSARLDVIICAMARFTIGNTSGISLVSTVFGIPCALTNMVPLAALGVSHRDISIPKLYWSISQKRHLTFEEIFESKLSQLQYNSEYIKRDIRLDENTKEEIKELVIEMMEKLYIRHRNSNLVSNLSDSFISMLKSQNYSFGTSSSISESFLNRHYTLLLKH